MNLSYIFTLWFILMITLINVCVTDMNFDDARSRTKPTRLRIRQARRKD